MTIADDLDRLTPNLGKRRAWWLREALWADPGAPCPPLEGDVRCDVAIVGGGFTGLWTAWQLVEQAPGIRVTILETDIVGGGASGRNGGFLTGWWGALPGLVASFGNDAGIAAAMAADECPAAVTRWCAEHGVDAWIVPGGTLLAETSPAQAGAFDRIAAAMLAAGRGERVIRLEPEDARRRSGSPVLGAGLLLPGDINVQPARLARGLRRILLERGVVIHEGSKLRRLRRGTPHRLETRDGTLRADHVVLAMNAWAAGRRPFGSRLVTWSSYMILTEPVPDRLAQIGYAGGEAITDGRFTNHYWRTTRDGRIAFGGGGGRAGYGGRVGAWTTEDVGSVRLAIRGFRRLYPQLEDVPLEDAWGGPIDISPNHLPMLGTLPAAPREPASVHFGHGFSGNGVGPAYLAGRILAAMALERHDDPLLGLPIVGALPRRFPPEPLRYLGARAVREAIVAKEQHDDLGEPSTALVRGLARLPRRMGYDLGPEDPAGRSPADRRGRT